MVLFNQRAAVLAASLSLYVALPFCYSQAAGSAAGSGASADAQAAQSSAAQVTIAEPAQGAITAPWSSSQLSARGSQENQKQQQTAGAAAGANAAASAPLASADKGIDGKQKLEPTKYALTPDPEALAETAGSPQNEGEAAREAAGASLRSAQVGGTGGGLPQGDHIASSLTSGKSAAALSPTKIEEIGKNLRTVAAKYDITKIGDRGIGKGVNFYSVEKEEALGKELSKQVEANLKLLDDPVITEYVNRVGQNLVRHSDAQVPFTIKVVDDEQVNAFALPGGYFYVNSGLLMAADNEAELAGVMAHEIAHVAARHVTKTQTKKDIWDLVSLPMIFVGGPVGAAVRQAAGIAAPMSFLKFSRDAEREADLLGMQYEYAAGYDPAEFVNFFEKLQLTEKHKQGFIAKAFSTHPMTEDRVKRAEVELSTMLPAREDYVVTTSEFDAVKARLAQVLHGRRLANPLEQKPTLKKRQ